MALDAGGAGGNSPNKKRQKDYNDLLKDKINKPKNQGGQPQRQGAAQRNRGRRRATARQGDTLNTIADKAGVHADELARANPKVDKVRPGMILNIPNAPAGPQSQGQQGGGGFFGGVTAQALQQKRAEGASQDLMRGRGYRRNQGTTSQIPQGAGYQIPTPQRGYGPPNPVGLRIRDLLKKGEYGQTGAGIGKSEEQDKMLADRAMGYAARFRKQVRMRGGDVQQIGATYGPYVPFGPPGPNGEAPVAPFATYNEPIAQGEGVFGTYVIEDVFNAGGLPVSMTTNQANTLGLDPTFMAELYYIDEWGNWRLLMDEQEEEQAPAGGGGGWGGYPGGGGFGFGGGGGGGRSLGASPDWLQNSPFDNGLTSWSIR